MPFHKVLALVNGLSAATVLVVVAVLMGHLDGFAPRDIVDAATQAAGSKPDHVESRADMNAPPTFPGKEPAPGARAAGSYQMGMNILARDAELWRRRTTILSWLCYLALPVLAVNAFAWGILAENISRKEIVPTTQAEK